MYSKFTYPLVKNPHNIHLLEKIEAEARVLREMPIRALPYSTFKLFAETGSRLEYENEYMQHRKMLCAYCGTALVDESWIPDLCDIIWAICDEYTWALPAHLSREKLPHAKVTRVDLFAAETAIGLSEIYHIFGDALPEEVRKRMVYELRRRVVDPYVLSPRRFPASNWSAVCIFGIIAPLIYLGLDEEFATVRSYIDQSMQDFLSSNTDDGCCLEGSLYWAYGFGMFSFAAELLREYTKGEMDYFQLEKVRRLAYYGQNTYLRENFTIPFADAGHTLNYDSGLFALLAEKYEGIIPPASKYAKEFGDDVRYRFPYFIRALYWGRETKEPAEDKRCIFYKDAGWYINKKNDYIFAAKAGHNNEPHNHNDVGSFLVFDKGRFILDDPGWPQYYKDYFGPHRYENPCASSQGHCVPIVDGKVQKPGKEHGGVVTNRDDNTFSMEYAGAYGLASLTELTRSFTLGQSDLTFKECAKGSFSSFTERFVTRIQPVIKGNAVKIDEYTLTCDKTAAINLSSFTFIPRFSGLDGIEDQTETAYTIDFTFENFTEAEFKLYKDC